MPSRTPITRDFRESGHVTFGSRFCRRNLARSAGLRRRAGPRQSQLPVAGATAGQTTNPAAFTVPTAAGGTNPYLVPNLAVQWPGQPQQPLLGGNSSASLANGGGYSPPYNPYFNPYAAYCSPYGGGLMGLAALTTANAQFYVTIQQGRIVNQQANQAMIDTRRKIFDQIRYQRMSIPSGEEIRVRDLETVLNRSRRDPPLGRSCRAHRSTVCSIT